MAKKIFLFILLLAFSVQLNLFSTHPNSIQEKKDQEELKHEVTVVLKLVQVYVTDKKGNPITDLEKSDFILYDNGKLQTVTDFEKHLLVRPVKKAEEEIAETELPPAEDISSRMNRKFFLLLDIDRNSSVGISKSKKAALHFIDTQLQPTDEVGVFSYSFIRRLVLHQYLTSEHERAREAIKRIKEVPGNLSAGEGAAVVTGGGSGSTPFSQSSFQMGDSDFSILAAEKKEGTDVLLVEFQLPELEAGEYSVEIIAEEMTTQERSQVSRTFRVK